MNMKFVITGPGRSGSTLLTQTLNTLDQVCCHGELLSRKAVRGYRDGFEPIFASATEREARRESLIRTRTEQPVAFIVNALESRTYGDSTPNVGFLLS